MFSVSAPVFTKKIMRFLPALFCAVFIISGISAHTVFSAQASTETDPVKISASASPQEIRADVRHDSGQSERTSTVPALSASSGASATFTFSADSAFFPLSRSASTAPPALIIFTDSISWNDISPQDTPHLAAWAASGAMFNIVPPDLGEIYCPTDIALAYSLGESTLPFPGESATDCSVSSGSDYLSSQIQRLPDSFENSSNFLGFFSATLNYNQINTFAIGNTAAAILLNRDGQLPENYSPAAPSDTEFITQINDSLHKHQLTIADASDIDFRIGTHRKISSSTASDPNYASSVNHKELSQQSKEFVNEYRKNNLQRLEQLFAQIQPGTPVMCISLMNLYKEKSLLPGFISTGFSETGANIDPDREETDSHKAKSQTQNLQHPDPEAKIRQTVFDQKVRQPGTVLYTGLLPTFFKLIGADTAEYAQIYLKQDPHAQISPATPNTGISETDNGNKTASANATSPATVAKKFSLNTKPLQFIGENPKSCKPNESCFTKRQTDLADRASRSTAITQVRGAFTHSIRSAAIIFLLFALALGPAHKILSGFRTHRKRDRSRKNSRFLQNVFSLTGLTVSGVLISSHLLTIFVPWWRSENPIVLMLGGSWGISLIFAVFSRFIFRGKNIFLPALSIFMLTSLLLLIDIATGSRHLIDAPLGFDTLAGARFYGIGNEGFAILAGTSLILFAFIPSVLNRIGHKYQLKIQANTSVMKRVAILLLGICGIITLVLIAAPKAGADFGGAISFSIAWLLLLFLTAQIRISWKKTFLFGLVGIFAAMGVAYLDWLRGPNSRTHLGDFIQSVFDGEAGEIIIRKITVNLRLLVTSPYRFVVLVALAVIILIIVPKLWGAYGMWRECNLLSKDSTPKIRAFARVKGDRTEQCLEVGDGSFAETGAPIPDTAQSVANKSLRELCPYEKQDDPALSPLKTEALSVTCLKNGFLSVGICLLIAFAVNDSGIVLPGMGAIAVLPALLPSIQVINRDK